MRSNMTIYEGAFVNQETNTANENIQQLIAVRLFDTETDPGNSFNALFRVVNNGDATQNVVFTYALPGGTVSAAVGYNDGSGWTDTDIPLTSTRAVLLNIPQGDYSYSIIVDGVRTVFAEGQTIDLEMGGTPLLFSVIDNSEDKFTAIKSKQVEIQLHSSNTVDISKFAEGGDNRFYVEIETQAEGIIFMGWLSVEDLSQEFLPDPNIITLVATDGLGFLEDEPLVNFENETPINEQSIINFIVWALGKTGLSLDVKVCMNIRENFAVPLVSDDTGEGHFYKFIYLDAKTFEDEVGTCEDCKTVLEKILGENSRLVQYKGKWLILRIDEMETSHEYFFTRFNYLGEFVEKTTETYTKNVGVGLPLSWMNDDCEVSLVRPYKAIIEKFNYKYPEELVCNIDFSRGVEVISAPDLSAPTSTGTYEVECWQMRRISGSITSTQFIEKLFEFGYEKERYLVITPKTGTATPYDFTQGTPIQISQGDKIDFSVDYRFRTGFTTSAVTYFPCVIWIQLDNGDRYYWYNSSTPIDLNTFGWVFRAAGSGEANFYMPSNVAAGFDFSGWTTISDTLDAAPVAGKLYIGLIQLHQGNDPADNQDGFFGNLNVTIRPMINGSYQNYVGQQNKLSTDNSKIKAIRETEVFISDAPRIAMKGALLKQGTTSVLFTGEVSFSADNQLIIFSDAGSLFTIGSTISISGSALNDGQAVIQNIEVVTIIGTTTTITVDKETFVELIDPVTLSLISFVLAGRFYNAALFPAGPGDLYLYGQLQAFDVWNQFNRVMRTFEGTIDRTDSTTQLPDILHKYILKDINPNTTNGTTQYRIFMLLHFNMNMDLCELAVFIVEVFNTDNAKTYETYEFKFITSEDA